MGYTDTDAHGYSIAHVQGHLVNKELVTINQVNKNNQQATQEKRRARFVVPKTEKGQ